MSEENRTTDTDRTPPRRERHHYVARWMQNGFKNANGRLHAHRIDEARSFETSEENLFVGTNVNTVLSDDRSEVLAYSENAFTWVDNHGAEFARAIIAAASKAEGHPSAVIVDATEKTLSWIDGLFLTQLHRTPISRKIAMEAAETAGLEGKEREVFGIAAMMQRLPRIEAYLKTGQPTVIRTPPDHPLVLGDDVIVKGPCRADGRASFLGVMIDERTIVGLAFSGARTKRGAMPIRFMTPKHVDETNTATARKAETVAGSDRDRVDEYGRRERERRQRDGSEPVQTHVRRRRPGEAAVD